MWIKKAWLQVRLCASAVTAWPVSSMQHPNFSGAVACEGFLKRIILLPSRFECSGCVQSMSEGTRGVLLCNQELCWCLYRGCQSGSLWCCFYLQWKEDLQLSTKTLWQGGHFVSSCSGAVGEPRLPRGVSLDQQVLRSSWHWLCCSQWWQTLSGAAILNVQDCGA